MSIGNRKPEPKKGKITNPELIKYYKNDFPYCELCGKTNRLEIHHIIGGIYRTDELWNIVHLCHWCHYRATEHANGSKAKALNDQIFEMKFEKQEITKEKLRELQRCEWLW